MNGSEFRPVEALACVPAITSLIAFGLALGDMTGGAGLLTLLMALLRPAVPVLVGLIAATAWTCYAFLRVNYAILESGNHYVAVPLFAIAGLPEPLVALHREVATLLGEVIAPSAHLVGIAAMQSRHRHDNVKVVRRNLIVY